MPFMVAGNPALQGGYRTRPKHVPRRAFVRMEDNTIRWFESTDEVRIPTPEDYVHGLFGIAQPNRVMDRPMRIWVEVSDD